MPCTTTVVRVFVFFVSSKKRLLAYGRGGEGTLRLLVNERTPSSLEEGGREVEQEESNQNKPPPKNEQRGKMPFEGEKKERGEGSEMSA